MRKNESGQALVLVLLSLAVVLTIILFMLSRSITDISISSGQAESVRAFSAAEAGIEKALIVGAGVGLTEIGDATYSSKVSSFAEGTSDFNYPSPLVSGETMTTWFVAHDVDGNIACSASLPCFTGNTLKVCWGNTGSSADLATTPAVEVSVYYESTPGNLSTIKIARATFDPNAGRRSSNSFAVPDSGTCSFGGTSFAFTKTITFSDLGIPAASYNSQNGLLFARVRLFYNTDIAHIVGTSVDFAGNSILPSQGIGIVSTGTAGSSNRRINVFQGWPEFPFSGSAIYTPESITK
jgi:Tfp pilus assembly protein PilX